MTTEEFGVSVYELELADDQGRLGLAAARAAGSVASVLASAMQRSGLTSRELARRLNVTEGRVSQVLNGDGNFHIATIARFLSAMGADLMVDAVDERGRSVRPQARRRDGDVPRSTERRMSYLSTYRLDWVHTGGVSTAHIEIEHPEESEPVLGRTSRVAVSEPSRWEGSDAATWSELTDRAVIGESIPEDCNV